MNSRKSLIIVIIILILFYEFFLNTSERILVTPEKIKKLNISHDQVNQLNQLLSSLKSLEPTSKVGVLKYSSVPVANVYIHHAAALEKSIVQQTTIILSLFTIWNFFYNYRLLLNVTYLDMLNCKSFQGARYLKIDELSLVYGSSMTFDTFETIKINRSGNNDKLIQKWSWQCDDNTKFNNSIILKMNTQDFVVHLVFNKKKLKHFDIYNFNNQKIMTF